MRVFVCGDTHGGQHCGFSKLSSKNFKVGKKLSKDDFLIIAGDFGLFWNVPQSKEELYYMKWLINKPWTTLFIDGNHENFEILENLTQIKEFGGIVGVYKFQGKNIYHLKRGEVYIIGGKKIFTFGGGTSIDKNIRKSVDWWPQESPSCYEYINGIENLKKFNFEVDYVITHDCPASIHSNFRKYQHETELQNYLEKIYTRIKFKKWYFGHYHEDIDFNEKISCLYNRVEELL